MPKKTKSRLRDIRISSSVAAHSVRLHEHTHYVRVATKQVQFARVVEIRGI